MIYEKDTDSLHLVVVDSNKISFLEGAAGSLDLIEHLV